MGRSWASFGAALRRTCFRCMVVLQTRMAAGDAGILSIEWCYWTPLRIYPGETACDIGHGRKYASGGRIDGIVRQRTSGVWHKMDGGPGFSVTKSLDRTWRNLGGQRQSAVSFCGHSSRRARAGQPTTLHRTYLTAAGRRSYDPTGAKIDGFAVSQEGVLFGITVRQCPNFFATNLWSPRRCGLLRALPQRKVRRLVMWRSHPPDWSVCRFRSQQNLVVQLWPCLDWPKRRCLGSREGGTIPALEWVCVVQDQQWHNRQPAWRVASSASMSGLWGESGTVLSLRWKRVFRASAAEPAVTCIPFLARRQRKRHGVAGESGAILSGGCPVFP